MKRATYILICLLLFLTSARQAEAKVYLVSVGIKDYPGTDNDLRHATDDAQRLVKTYRTVSSGLIYVQLYDNRATVKNILSSVQQLFSKASANDIVILFISGHGFDGGFVAYDGPLTYSRMRKAMSRSKSRYKMIFADACYSGTFRSKYRQKSVSERKNNNSNVMLFLSSRSDETSIESGALKHGVFSAYLCSGLSGKADANKDRIVTAHELYSYVHKGVVNNTGGRQHPVMWGKFSNDMPVMLIKKK